MKRFLTAVVAAFFLLTTVAHAERVQIYDHSVNDILNDIKETGEYMKKDNRFANVNLAIWGTHYYTGTDGFRYCESHFGDSDKNCLIFRVNNNGVVSSAWIIIPVYTLAGEDNNDGNLIGGVSLWSILDVIGMSDDESDLVYNGLTNWCNALSQKLDEADDALNRNDDRLYEQKMNEVKRNFLKTFSVWCAKAKRYIDVQLSMNIDNATVQFYIYAHI